MQHAPVNEFHGSGRTGHHGHERQHGAKSQRGDARYTLSYGATHGEHTAYAQKNGTGDVIHEVPEVGEPFEVELAT